MQRTLDRPGDTVIRRPRMSRRVLLNRLGIYILLIGVGLFFVLPLLWMISEAFKPQEEWYQPNLIPLKPTLQNFNVLFQPGAAATESAPLLRWLGNSSFVALISAAAGLIVSAPAAYAYGRLDFPGKKLMFGVLIYTLLIPGVLFLTPNFIIVSNLGWLNTYQALIIPGLGGTFGVFFLRQFFLSLPTEMEEAMLIDGAGRLRILWQLVIPLSKGALATLFVLGVLGSWNEYTWALITMTDDNMLTLPVGLAKFQGQYANFPGYLMAGALLASAPVLILFALMQRFIVESIATVGLKQ